MPVPWALELLHLCKRYSAMPRAGGVLDQEPFELCAMHAAERVQQVYNMSLIELVQSDLLQLRDRAEALATELQRRLWSSA